jgi:hypothetical protein
MPTIISMQDVRMSLAAIAKRAGTGESFVVVRNSRPAFRIEPPTGQGAPLTASSAARSLDSITARLEAATGGTALTEAELDRIIHDVHRTTCSE